VSLRDRPLEWSGRDLGHGAVLDAFGHHCEHELADVELVDHGPVALTVRWRRETVRVELADEIEAPATPTLALAPLSEALIGRLLDDDRLRARLAVYDLVRLEKANAVRSAIPTYFEWFLREAYGVKIAASGPFTAGLVARGLLSLGMG
jgi:hypothetical protein